MFGCLTCNKCQIEFQFQSFIYATAFEKDLIAYDDLINDLSFT